MTSEHFDVLIMGAGLSGIDAAHHLNKFCPERTYVILEQRERIGGTWDLFRYPGIRSDSDMLTMGYSFRPWTNPETISPGAKIRQYIEDTALEEGIEKHIRFRHAVKSAAWSSADARWTVEAVANAGDPVHFTCNFLFSCAGYYRYSEGYNPAFPGADRFKGRIVHPQHWPEDLDYAGKRVVVIGSGATAVTLIPAMSELAAHVTMLQRSPTYVVSRPAKDAIAAGLRSVFPARLAWFLSRWKNILLGTYVYRLARAKPEKMKKRLIDMAAKALGPGVDVARHFTPRYNPWEQRLCLVPDNDLFTAIRSGKASVVTAAIDAFTETGIRLQTGEELPADVIVTATGLQMQAYGGVALSVDGRAVDISKTLAWKGVMLSGVPNFAAVFGYINASWTLKADLVCLWLCRLLNYMKSAGRRIALPNAGDEKPVAPFVEHFSSGYMQRALESWPKQGSAEPWRANQNYFKDIAALKRAPVADEGLDFPEPSAASTAHESELVHAK